MPIEHIVRDRVSALLSQVGKSAVYRHVTFSQGSTPAPNPPSRCFGLVVDGNASAGATQISFRADSLHGRFIPGDNFRIAGDTTTYTVTNEVAASANRVVNLPFSPSLVVAANDGAAVTPIWSAEKPIKIRLADYPLRLVDGTHIQTADVRVAIPGSALSTAPVPGDKIIVDGVERTVIHVSPQYIANSVGIWWLQAR